MATATVARPSQALRTRRDLPPKRASAAMDSTGIDPAGKRRKVDEPYVVTDDYILRKFSGKPPSLVVQLHQAYFKFMGSESSFPYDSPGRVFLESLRKQQVPHDMIEELLAENVTFYDGCLIVEVHNHRSVNGKDKAKQESAIQGGQAKYSMHNYNSYVTPSGFVAYPKKAKEHEAEEKNSTSDAKEQVEDKESKKEKDKNGPRISTIVMHPTPLSQRREMLILASTPASELRGKKKSTDGGSSAGQPSTPQVSVPPTPSGVKMCLDSENWYQFEADLLLATQPPLLLEPAKNPQEAENALRLLEHPFHSEQPPSPKTRKRTTAEMAADDAQAAEAERRMLIMDERIKPAAPGASDAAGAAQAMGFSRFKTIQMVREKHEEQERQKKEEEAQAAIQRRQQEEAEKLAQQKAQIQSEKQKQILQQRQRLATQQQQDLRQQQLAQAQAAQLMAQNHAHPQQSNWNPQQASFQHQGSMAQSSPVVRQQTPMMNSSPMLGQNGFPMTATTSQGAGSPPRPTSAMPNSNLAMARQVSQQQHGSRNATPQMTQGTPHLTGAMPRQMSQTPRMSHASPAPGTPAAINMSQMPMQTPQNMNAAQLAMLQHQMNQGGMNAGSPGQNINTMTPEQIQNINSQQRARQQMLMAQNNPQMQQVMAQRQAMMIRQQQQQQQLLHQQRMMQQQNANGGQAGSPMQGTPQMGHGHPQQGGNDMGQQMTPQQRQQMILRAAQNQIQALVQQYGSWNAIPQSVAQGLPQAAQSLLRQQHQRANAQRAQQMAMRAQAAQNSGQPVAGSSHGDPEYMATLRNHQAMLAQQAHQSSQGGMNMNNLNFGSQQFGGQGQNDLSQQFAAMQNALQRSGGTG